MKEQKFDHEQISVCLRSDFLPISWERAFKSMECHKRDKWVGLYTIIKDPSRYSSFDAFAWTKYKTASTDEQKKQ